MSHRVCARSSVPREPGGVAARQNPMGSTHDRTTSAPIRRGIIGAATAAALAFSGCSGNDDAASDSRDATAEAPAEESEAFEFADDEIAAPEVDGDALPNTGGRAEAGFQVDLSDRDIITSVELTMSTSNVRSTADDVRRLAESNGAAVFSSEVSLGDDQPDGSVPGGGQIVIRVVPAQLDGLVSALDGAGTVTRLSQDSQDVTDQLVDLEIRIRQIETSIERLEILLDDAAELDDVFEIERELTSRVIELEQLRASERNTENLVSLATLTVQIEYRTPDAIDDIGTGDDGIADAFSDGWGAFVGAIFAIGYALAVSAPFLVTALTIVALVWFAVRRRGERVTGGGDTNPVE